jgi:hypothetical protein
MLTTRDLPDPGMPARAITSLLTVAFSLLVVFVEEIVFYG